MKKLAFLLLFVSPVWAQNWPSFRGENASGIGGKGQTPIHWNIEKDSFIAAFDLETGNKVWSTPRKTIPSWSTPTVYEGENRSELIISGSEDIRGYDVLTGRELWSLRPTSSISIPSPFAARDLIYVASGYRRGIQPIYAIRPGSSGDISLKEGTDANEQIAWSTQKGRIVIRTLSQLVGIGMP